MSLSQHLQSQIEVKINELHCAVPDDLIIATSWWNYAKANCTMPQLTAGRYNYTFAVQDASNGAGLATYPTPLAVESGECLPMI